MQKIFILFFIFLLIQNYSFSDCITGYACSIKELNSQNIEQEKEFVKYLNEYFDFNINEDFMLGVITKEFKYKDFFPFTVNKADINIY